MAKLRLQNVIMNKSLAQLFIYMMKNIVKIVRHLVPAGYIQPLVIKNDNLQEIDVRLSNSAS